MPDPLLKLPSDPQWRRTLVAVSSVELRCDEFYSPDLGVPAEYDGPRLVAVSFGERLATLGPGGHAATGVETEAAAGILAAARGVLEAEPMEARPDTAVGRVLTVLRLRLDDARGTSESRTAVVSHILPALLPDAWSRLLRRLRDAAGAVPPPLDEDWQHALRWVGPQELGADFTGWQVVRLPHRHTSFACGAPIWLRSGQPPGSGPGVPAGRPGVRQRGPSRLYRLDPVKRQLEPEGGAMLTLEPDQVHVLPCGAAELRLVTSWGRDTLLEVRVLDGERWIFVQRA